MDQYKMVQDQTHAEVMKGIIQYKRIDGVEPAILVVRKSLRINKKQLSLQNINQSSKMEVGDYTICIDPKEGPNLTFGKKYKIFLVVTIIMKLRVFFRNVDK